MAYLLNRCRFEAGSAGTADFDDGTAVQGFLNLADAGAVNGRIYPYGAENATRTEWEIGYGTYDSGGGALERTSIVASSNSDNAVNFGTNPVVFISPLVAEFIENPTANGRAIVQAANYAAMRALLDLEAGTDFLALSDAVALAGAQSITGRKVAVAGAHGNSGIATATGSLGEFEVRGNGTGAAAMTFHRPSSRAEYFGLDTDNQWKVGGWSAGANSYVLAQNRIDQTHVCSSIELGHATDTTLTRDSAGVIAVEGIPVYPQIPQTSLSAATTLTAAHANRHILHPSSDNNARTFTIPANSSVPYPIGTVIMFVNMINVVTIAINTDTLIWSPSGSTGSRNLAANGAATAVKIASQSWLISGNGLT